MFSRTRQANVVPESRRDLAGRVGIATGSTSGIGLGIASGLAARGAAIVLNGFGDATDVECPGRSAPRPFR